jgi:hypothetical protein
MVNQCKEGENNMTMKINLITTISPGIHCEPGTKKEWALVIGLAIILVYMLGYMITNCLMR